MENSSQPGPVRVSSVNMKGIEGYGNPLTETLADRVDVSAREAELFSAFCHNVIRAFHIYICAMNYFRKRRKK